MVWIDNEKANDMVPKINNTLSQNVQDIKRNHKL